MKAVSLVAAMLLVGCGGDNVPHQSAQVMASFEAVVEVNRMDSLVDQYRDSADQRAALNAQLDSQGTN